MDPEEVVEYVARLATVEVAAPVSPYDAVQELFNTVVEEFKRNRIVNRLLETAETAGAPSEANMLPL